MKSKNEKALGKISRLEGIIRRLGSVVVAFSGGVDSTFLLRVASDTLGRNNVLAVIARSETYPRREYDEALAFVKDSGIPHKVISTDELKIKNYSNNPVDRCYYCKKELFGKIDAIRNSRGFGAVLDGTNYDDRLDVRHGTRAAAELGVVSPLSRAKFTKDNIRYFSRKLGLKTHNKASFACLASRFPHSHRITRGKLNRVDRAEEFIKSLGYAQVRVRDYGDMARIELYKSDIKKFAAKGHAPKVSAYLKRLGYAFVTLDLEGYRTGSMNA